MDFQLVTDLKPAGSQPEAITKLVEGLKKHPAQTLLGITGSGKSLDYTELLIVMKEDGTLEKVPIGEYVERRLRSPMILGDTEYEDVLSEDKIVSFNPVSKEIKEKHIIQVSRHREQRIFNITLDDNTTLKVTGDHNCFTFEDGEFTLKPTKELRLGDYLPLSNVTFVPEKFTTTVNLLKLNPDKKVNIADMLHLFDNVQLRDALRLETTAPNWKRTQIVQQTKERGIFQSTLTKILTSHAISLEHVLPHVRIISKANDLPAQLVLDEDALVFLGLYVSEGHHERTWFTITNSQPHLQKTVLRFCERYGVRARWKSSIEIVGASHALCNFLKEFGINAGTKQIPNVIYNLSDTDLGTFLRSMFDGDGWVEPGSTMYCSKSRTLIDDLRRLLLRFTITTRVHQKLVKGTLYYTLSISGRQNLLRFQAHINFSIDYKKSALARSIKDVENTNVDLVPGMGGFLKRTRSELGLHQRQLAHVACCTQAHISMVEGGQRLISQQLMGNVSEWLYETQYTMPELRNLSYFNFRSIVDIEEIESTNGYVYDIAVEDNETFAVGGGNVFVHNTFTMANVIEQHKKPTLVLAHNKTLAAQLYYELKELFPKNRVEYFVSYYDYYQPESYLPSSDTYIEKDAQVNDRIDKMRLKATASLLSRSDVIVVASISCIYGLGDPKSYFDMSVQIKRGLKMSRNDLLAKLVDIQYARNDDAPVQGEFRVRGDTVDIRLGYEDTVLRIAFFGDEIETMQELDAMNLAVINELADTVIFPAKHYVISPEKQAAAVAKIKEDLKTRVEELDAAGNILAAHRLKQRTTYDLEMIEQLGYCSGIENYSLYFDGRKIGEPPYCLLDFFPEDFLMIIDESHATIPQARGMFHGDWSRKAALVEHGFRLPTAHDNRPLKFEEFERYLKHVIFVSATPADYEKNHSKQIVEQIIRPTGLLDPTVEVRPITGQVDDLLSEIRLTVAHGNRVLVTTLTKRMSEELTEHFEKAGVKVRYLHSEIQTLERTETIRQLRAGNYDVLVGVNLLREGLDIPEVELVAILDADKEGFLRTERSLIQTLGRAARNASGRAILYADRITPAMRTAIDVTASRRALQIAHNTKHHISPKTIAKAVPPAEDDAALEKLEGKDRTERIKVVEREMKNAAANLDFERAIMLRDQLAALRSMKN